MPSPDTIRPNATGDVNELVNNGGQPQTNNWQFVDDIAPDEDGTDVVPGTSQRDSYKFSAGSGLGTITNVRVYARCRGGAGGGGTLQTIVKDNGTLYEDAGQYVGPDSYANYYHDWAKRPHDNQNWTWSDLAAGTFQAGIRLSISGFKSALYCTQVYVEISYTTATTAYKDIVTRFKLNAQNFKDIPTRFKLWAQGYKDIPTRFLLTVQGYRDIPTRFKIIVLGYTDTPTRFTLIVQNWVDIPTRFLLWVQNYVDIATRFILQIQGYRDIATRFLLYALGYRDINTRFILVSRNYCDTATRFYLITQPPLWHEWMFESDNYILQGRPSSAHCRT
jgi:hypothetical protein